MEVLEFVSLTTYQGAVSENEKLRALLTKHGLRVGDDGESLVYANPSAATLRNRGGR